VGLAAVPALERLMVSRSNKEIRASRERKQAILVQRKQTQSAASRSLSKFGFHKTTQHGDEIVDTIRIGAGSRRRHPAPITLAPLPWKD
jgi:hypothetical protein